MSQRKGWNKNKSKGKTEKTQDQGLGEKVGGTFTCRWVPIALRMSLPGVKSQVKISKSLMPRAADGEEK